MSGKGYKKKKLFETGGHTIQGAPFNRVLCD
jgi:hypothetical protein